jgi:hypothetical protein
LVLQRLTHTRVYLAFGDDLSPTSTAAQALAAEHRAVLAASNTSDPPWCSSGHV